MFRGKVDTKILVWFLFFASIQASAFRGFSQLGGLQEPDVDPYWEQVTVLLRCEAGLIQDLKGHTITNTSVALSSVYSKFGTQSCYFNGAAYLDFAANSDLVMGTSDFTIEGWVWTNTNTTWGTFIGGGSRYTGGLKGAFVQDRAAVIGEQQTVYEQIASFSPDFAIGQWQHFALVRHSGTLSMYIDGVMAGSTGATLNLDSNRLVIGRMSYDSSQYYMSGYIDEVRITKGIARYTSGFSPPQSPFPTNINPNSYSGLVLWLDASDGSTITESLGLISQWTDKSSSGLVFTQGTANNKPSMDTSLSLLPKTCVDFNFNTDNRFLQSAGNLSLGAAFTIFFAGYWNVSAGYTSFGVIGGTSTTSIQGAVNTGSAFIFSSPGNPGQPEMVQDNSGVVTWASPAFTSIDTRYLATFIRSGTGTYSILRTNGRALPLGGNTVSSSTFITDVVGSTDALYSSRGSIGEILIYNRGLSLDEIRSIESYLKFKWGTP